ncbi:hypothetical protein Glove_57g76 [Diversispora epigaea]|uniref:Uncharacterized protein n=1 Tax=Diversispora epigaea TaxID=1348612 RepID=A0A397JFQ1_9GLOM|nr:hypothetical protein Glove_57g76 [Diversispora epigaea]
MKLSFVLIQPNFKLSQSKGLKPPKISSVPATFVTTIVPDVQSKCSKMSWDENHLYFHEELIEIHKEYLLIENVSFTFEGSSRVGIVLEGNSRFCDYAIWHINKTYQKTYGPRFGTTTDKFLIVDYEVFKIIKKTC